MQNAESKSVVSTWSRGLIAAAVGAALLTGNAGFGPAAAPAKPAPGHDHGHSHAGHNHDSDLIGRLEKNESLSTLVGLLKQVDLIDALESVPAGGYTVFAPTNDAFSKVPEAALDDLLKPENKDKLKRLLLSHVVKGTVTSKDLKEGEVETLAGTKIKVVKAGNSFTIGGAGIHKADIKADNGIIHELTGVIAP